MSPEEAVEIAGKQYTFELTLLGDRRGFRLVDENRKQIGAVMQNVVRRGEWGFSNEGHTYGEWGFETEEAAKQALVKDLSK